MRHIARPPVVHRLGKIKSRLFVCKYIYRRAVRRSSRFGALSTGPATRCERCGGSPSWGGHRQRAHLVLNGPPREGMLASPARVKPYGLGPKSRTLMSNELIFRITVVVLGVLPVALAAIALFIE
jgi:hypothetical protein